MFVKVELWMAGVMTDSVAEEVYINTSNVTEIDVFKDHLLVRMTDGKVIGIKKEYLDALTKQEDIGYPPSLPLMPTKSLEELHKMIADQLYPKAE